MKPPILLCIVLIVTLLAAACPAPTPIQAETTAGLVYYVKPGENGDCLTWDTACDLQAALLPAGSGDQIWAAAGVYTPAGPGGPITATFTLKDGLALYGGFAGTESLLAERDPLAHLTVLSGDLDRDDLADPSGVLTDTAGILGANSLHVLTGLDLGPSAVLDGFTITAGSALTPTAVLTGTLTLHGGGLLLVNSRPALANLHFSANQAISGGGLFLEDSAPSLRAVTFTANRASSNGGGLYQEGGATTLEGVSFHSNFAAGDGAGLASLSAALVLTDTIFTANTTPGRGGGLFADLSTLTLSAAAFSANQAGQGAGLDSQTSSLVLHSPTFSANSASAAGGGLSTSAGTLTLTHAVFSGNSAGDGGGVYAQASTLAAADSTFSTNAAGNGGGLYLIASTLAITRTNFLTNTVTGLGGGLLHSGGSLFVLDALFSANAAGACGGALHLAASSPSLANTIFFANTAGESGGALCSQAASPSLVNVTFSANTAAVSGGALYNASSHPVLANAILWGDSAPSAPEISDDPGSLSALTYSIVAGGWPGAGNLDADPGFIDPLAGDLHLKAALTSPAIDAGDNAALPAGLVTDLDGRPRLAAYKLTGSPVVDLGAYEVPSPVLYVDGQAPGPLHDGTSWAQAFTSLPPALAAAVPGVQIWVKAGRYTPDPALRTAAFTLQSGVALYGGFAGGETQREARDPLAHLTVLSGDLAGDDLSGPGGVLTDTARLRGANSYHVVVANGVDSTAVLDGFTITAGQADGSAAHANGGGLHNANGSPTLANLVFSANLAAECGGGMDNNAGNPTLSTVTFTANHAGLCGAGMANGSGSAPSLSRVTFSANTSALIGGGMYNSASDPRLSGVLFQANQAAGWGGGGLYNEASSPAITNTTFISNTTAGSGGGMANTYVSHPVLTNVTFSGNAAGGVGGAVYCQRSDPTLINATLTNNTAEEGGGIYSMDNSAPVLTNAILWGNQPLERQIANSFSLPEVTYTIIQSGFAGLGNKTVDPLLGPLQPFPNGAWLHPLQPGSPAIDAGDPGLCSPTDQRGLSRPVDGDANGSAVCDMGTYEARLLATTTSLTATTPNPSGAGFPFTVSFTVTSPGWTPSGKVTVTVNGTPVACSAALSDGAGSCALILPSLGRCTLTATYSGGPGFAPSSATAAHTVQAWLFLPLIHHP